MNKTSNVLPIPAPGQQVFVIDADTLEIIPVLYKEPFGKNPVNHYFQSVTGALYLRNGIRSSESVVDEYWYFSFIDALTALYRQVVATNAQQCNDSLKKMGEFERNQFLLNEFHLWKGVTQ